MVDKAASLTVKMLPILLAICMLFVTAMSIYTKYEGAELARSVYASREVQAKDLQQYKESQARDMQLFRDSLPKEYVRSERYKSDCDRDADNMRKIEASILTMSNKIDRLLLHSGITPRGR